jgi:hypothetical protein
MRASSVERAMTPYLASRYPPMVSGDALTAHAIRAAGEMYIRRYETNAVRE